MARNSKAYAAAYYRKNRRKALANRKAYRLKNPERIRNAHLQNNYGITLVEYAQRLVAQNGVCAICRQTETAVHPGSKKIRALAVDHDHTTDQVRELVCHRCNSLLGYVADDPLLLRAAADYLEKHRGSH